MSVPAPSSTQNQHQSLPKLEHMSYECPGLGKESRMDVRPEDMGRFLRAQQVVIPLFQRRYCWTTKQLTQWVKDLMKNVRHGLGKSTFKWINDEFICIDGQQRITTTLLFVASARDALSRLPDSQSKTRLEHALLSHLYTDVDAYHAWVADVRENKRDDEDVFPIGGKLSFSRLIPSYLDRRPFFQAILGDVLGLPADASEEDSHQIQTKKFFDNYLSGKSITNLAILSQALLTKFYIMRIEVLTPINMSQVFLWLQEKSILGMGALLHNPAPGVDFSVPDLVRNLVLFEVMNEPMDVQERFYNERWVQPLELPLGDRFGEMILAFIDSLPRVPDAENKTLAAVTWAKKSGMVRPKKVQSLEAYGKICYFCEQQSVDDALAALLAFAECFE